MISQRSLDNKKMLKTLAILVVALLAFFSLQKPSDSMAEYNGIVEWENRANRSPSGFVDFLKMAIDFVTNCFIESIILDFTQLNNTCIPDKIGQVTETYCQGSQSYIGEANKSALIGAGFIVGAIIAAIAIPLIGPLIAVIVLGAIIIRMIDACSNTYVMQPYEYINQKMGATCGVDSDGKVYYKMNPSSQYKTPLNVNDVPFFYTCEKGKYGFMGDSTSLYCASQDKIRKFILEQSRAVGIGSIIVKRTGKWWNRRDRCDPNGEDNEIIFSRDEISSAKTKNIDGIFGIDLKMGAFYRYSSGYLQLCAVTLNTVVPVIVGCTYVPPPEEIVPRPAAIEKFTQSTRCNYFLSGRQDLNALGMSLDNQTTSREGGITTYSSVALFLQSDLHITSSVVGCIEDILIKVFIDPQSSSTSYLSLIQKGMKGIVYGLLTLYICLVGIKIMSSPQVPQMSEWIMYILKFALVVYFAVGDPWFEKSSITEGGKSHGLYATLLTSVSYVADIFLQASADNDPTGMCYYQNESTGGKNILSQLKYPSGEIGISTYNPYGDNDYIQLTTWDFLDCKLVNYINFGSCKYSISGLIGLWFIGGAFWSGFQGLLLMLLMIIYIISLFSIIFKFVHVVILSLFSITILVMVAPIMICFALFEYTKQTFQSWMRNLLGYVIAPGILFAFIALMLATLDSVFYGINGNDVREHGNDIVKACAKVNSVYCSLISTNSTTLTNSGSAAEVQQGTCQLLNGTIITNLTESFHIPLLGDFTVLKSVTMNAFIPAITKMMLFAILFYFFSQSVIAFVQALVGIQGLGDGAQGDISASTLAKGIASVASSGTTSAVSGLKKLLK